MRRMANSVNDEVVGFNSALKEASVFRNLTFLVHQNRKKKKQLLHWFWKGSTGRVAKWLWEKPDASGVGSNERNYDGETFQRSCRFSAPTYCLWSNGIDIFDRVSGSYAHGLAIILEDIESGKYQLVLASAENVLVKPFLSLMKKKKSTPFYHSMPVCNKLIMARKTSNAVVCASKYRLRSVGRKTVK